MATTRKKTGKRKSTSRSQKSASKRAKKKSTSARKRGGSKVSPLSTSKESDKKESTSARKTATDKVTEGTSNVAKDAMKKLENIQKEVAAPTREPSAKRSQSGTGNHPVPPEERQPGLAGTQATAAADMAAGAISAARDHLVRQEETEKRLKSDPRYERDQLVYKMGQEGKLGLVPPSDAEAAAIAERSGISQEVADKIPRTAEEQAADDKRRLEEAQRKSDATKSDNSGGTTSGAQE